MDGNRFSTFIHILHEGRTKGHTYEAPPFQKEREKEICDNSMSKTMQSVLEWASSSKITICY